MTVETRNYWAIKVESPEDSSDAEAHSACGRAIIGAGIADPEASILCAVPMTRQKLPLIILTFRGGKDSCVPDFVVRLRNQRPSQNIDMVGPCEQPIQPSDLVPGIPLNQWTYP